MPITTYEIQKSFIGATKVDRDDALQLLLSFISHCDSWGINLVSITMGVKPTITVSDAIPQTQVAHLSVLKI